MKKSVKLFCLALVVLLLSSIVVKGVDTSWGSAEDEAGGDLVRIFLGHDGGIISTHRMSRKYHKDVAMLVAFLDFALLLFALVQMLLDTKVFAGLVLDREI